MIMFHSLQLMLLIVTHGVAVVHENCNYQK